VGEAGAGGSELTIGLAHQPYDRQRHGEFREERSRRSLDDDPHRIALIANREPNRGIDEAEIPREALEPVSNRCRADDQLVEQRSRADGRLQGELQCQIRDPPFALRVRKDRSARSWGQIGVRVLDIDPS
jgi:hypothetical protein